MEGRGSQPRPSLRGRFRRWKERRATSNKKRQPAPNKVFQPRENKERS